MQASLRLQNAFAVHCSSADICRSEQPWSWDMMVLPSGESCWTVLLVLKALFACLVSLGWGMLCWAVALLLHRPIQHSLLIEVSGYSQVSLAESLQEIAMSDQGVSCSSNQIIISLRSASIQDLQLKALCARRGTLVVWDHVCPPADEVAVW